MKWYKYDIRDLSDSEYRKWYSLMDEKKRQRVDKFRFDDDKKRTVVGDMLARKAIAKRCGTTENDIVFDIAQNGKPYAVELDVEFNISHSGNMVICAIGNMPLGVDIERIRPVDVSVTKRICSEAELEFIFGHKPVEKEFCYTSDTKILTRFFTLWTGKEAYCKCIGTGIRDIAECKADGVKTFIDGEYVISIFTKD